MAEMKFVTWVVTDGVALSDCRSTPTVRCRAPYHCAPSWKTQASVSGSLRSAVFSLIVTLLCASQRSRLPTQVHCPGSPAFHQRSMPIPSGATT
jgi:hypothetical protein